MQGGKYVARPSTMSAVIPPHPPSITIKCSYIVAFELHKYLSNPGVEVAPLHHATPHPLHSGQLPLPSADDVHYDVDDLPKMHPSVPCTYLQFT